MEIKTRKWFRTAMGVLMGGIWMSLYLKMTAVHWNRFWGFDFIEVGVFGVFLYIICISLSYYAVQAVHILFGLCCGFRLIEWILGNVTLRWGTKGLRLEKLQHYKTGYYMAPPERENENYAYQLYNVGKVIAALLVSCLFLGFVWNMEVSKVWVIMFSFGVCWCEYAIYSMLFSFVLNRDKFKKLSTEEKRWYRMEMQMYECLVQGIRFEEMPEEWFGWTEETGIHDSRTEWRACFRLQYLRACERYKEAEYVAYSMLKCGNIKDSIVRYEIAITLIYVTMLLYEEVSFIQCVFESEKEHLLSQREADGYCLAWLYYKYIMKDEAETADYYNRYERAMQQKSRSLYLEEAIFRKYIEEKYAEGIHD